MEAAEERTPEIADTRTSLPFLAGERESLEGWLEFYRQTLPLKISGLNAEQLCRTAVLPSTMTLIGITRHLSDVERYWFSNVAAGTQQRAHFRAADPDADFSDYSQRTAMADVRHYDAEIVRMREIAAQIPDLDAPLAGMRHGKEINLRWIYTHLIEEYARHLGHADLIRECIDGATGY